MTGSWVRRYRAAVRSEFDAAVRTRHTPRQIAASFAFGLFVTALPTLGAGLVLFVVLSRLVPTVSRLALFSSVVVLNPIVKGGVYAVSLSVGLVLLGPVSGLEADPVVAGELATRVLVGTIVVGAVLSAVGYAFAHRFATRYGREHI